MFSSRALLRRLILLIPTTLLLLFLSSAGWLLLTANGLGRATELLAWISEDAVRIQGAHGRLLGPLRLDQVEIRVDADRYRLHDVTLAWDLLALGDGLLDIRHLRAERVELQLAASSDELSGDLHLPFALRIAALEIGAIASAENTPPFVRDLTASVRYDGQRYALEQLAMQLEAGHLNASGRLEATPPFALSGEAQLHRSAAPALQITAQATGTLTALALQLEGQGSDFSLSAQAQLQPFLNQPLTALQLSARGLNPRLFLPQAPRARLTLKADLHAEKAGALAGTLRLDNSAAAPLDQHGLPFSRAEAELHLDWNSTPRSLALSKLQLRLGTDGSASGHASLRWPAGEVLPQGNAGLELQRINPASLHTALFPARLTGQVMFSGNSTAQQATLALNDGTRRLEAKLDHRGDTLNFSRLLLAQGRAELAANGSVQLRSPHQWRIAGTLQHFDPAAFVDRLPRADLNADFSAAGQLVPQLGGHLNFQLDASRLLGQTLAGKGELRFSGVNQLDDLIAANGKAWVRGTLDLALSESRLNAQGGWGSPAETLQFTLKAPDLARHQALLPGLGGTLALAATLNGFPARPEVRLNAQASRLTLPAWGHIGGLDTTALLQGETLQLSLNAENISPQGTRKEQQIPQLVLHVDGTRAQHRLNITANLPEARRLELAASGALVESATDWRDSGWRGRFERLQLDGELPVSVAAEGELAISRHALAGRLLGRIPDLRGLGPAIDGSLTSAGALDFDAEFSGRPDAPRLRGHVRGNGLAIGLLDHNVHLREGVLALRFEETQAVLERLDFTARHDPPARAARVTGFPVQKEPGRLGITGVFDVEQRKARFIAQLTRLPLSQRPERWLVASGTARLEHAQERLRLGAKLVTDAGFIAEVVASHPKLSPDIVVLGRDAPPPRTWRAETDMTLDLGQRFHLRAAGLTARLQGQLRVRGDSALPLSASGSIAAQDATFEAYGQRLVVERGIVNFQGPLDDPGLNVLALRKGTLVEAGVTVTGTAQRPVVRLVSTPPVPDSEKLSWIVLGRVPDASGTDTSLLLAAAGSILGGQSESLTSQIAQAFGVDEFSLRQSADGDTLSSQILSVGKRLSARSWLSYEQGLNAATGALKFTYSLTPHVSIVTRAGEETAVDVFYNFAFD